MTLGARARAMGFNSLKDMVDAGLSQMKEAEQNAFKLGEVIRLKENYTPTHFKEEAVLSHNTDFEVIQKSDFTLGRYFVKIKGYEVWFCASVFERKC
jgi:hypothetical protein